MLVNKTTIITTTTLLRNEAEELISEYKMHLLNNSTSPLITIHVVDLINCFLMAIGIITNILCICIFIQKSSIKTKFNWYLLTLAIFELLFCIVVFSDYLYRILSKDTIFLHDLNIYITVIMDFLAHTTDSYTIIITLILSIDRLYAITNPMKAKDFLTNLHPKFLIFISLLVLVLIKIPATILCYIPTSISTQNAQMIYCSFVSPIILNVLPAIVILVLNVILIIKIIRYNQSNKVIRTFSGRIYIMARVGNVVQPMTKLRKSHYFIIIMIAIWLILTNIPYYTLFAYQFGLNFYFIDFLTLVELQLAISVFFNSNHCINFFIYVCFHDVFRSNLVKIFSP